MATLAEAVDAAETDWLVSADIPDSVDYLTVESEVVQVTATFPAQYQARDGSTSAPRIRVVRAAGGTTAASHADGTTLTPLIPPSAGAGGAAALSLDNTIDPPSDITSLVAAGATVVGSEATLRGKDFYAQDTDPGAVGVGSVWKDTTTGNFWTRNGADDGWDPVFIVSVASDGQGDASAAPLASATGADSALVGPIATVFGVGNAVAGPSAVSSGGGAAVTTSTATASDGGNADVRAIATADDGGDAFAESSATAEDTGTATAGATATADGGTAGIQIIADAISARMAFNSVTPIARPELPASPTEQDIADVLVALGLATQAP